MSALIVIPVWVLDAMLVGVYALGLSKGLWWAWAWPRLVKRWRRE